MDELRGLTGAVEPQFDMAAAFATAKAVDGIKEGDAVGDMDAVDEARSGNITEF
jgi:hypothetical protein